MSRGPNIGGLLAGWFGGDSLSWNLRCGIGPNFGAASNLIFGSNPPYQISDFLAFYPKFGTQPQGVVAATPNSSTPGLGYVVGDLVNLIQTDASGALLAVASLNLTAPASYTVVTPGTGYSVAAGLSTVTVTGVGTGALVDVTQITSLSGYVPQLVLQTFINLASACLQQARWQDSWTFAMGLFVAHYATLWLDSEGNPVSSAGQAAISGLGKGIAVSKAAGDVSVGYETQVDADWTSFNLTKYGQQLVTMAKVIGMGPMYVP